MAAHARVRVVAQVLEELQVDEPVLKQKIGAGQPISAPKPKGKKSFFQNLFTPPWRSCACNG